jgi:hypothetical protein
VWTKAEEHVVKIEKEYCKENCIDRSVIEPAILSVLLTTGVFFVLFVHIILFGISSRKRNVVV